MTRAIKIIVSITLLWLCSGHLKGLHIVGGDVVYDCLGIDTIANTATFLITFTMYRDAAGNGAEFDTNGEFGIFRASGNSWLYLRSITGQSASGIEKVNNVVANPCLIVPPNLNVEKGVYQFQVTLPIIEQSYMIAYQRCCRNVTINNIIAPDETGAAFTIEISSTAQKTCNNSPKFKNFPPIVVCIGEPVDFDHGAEDDEGDQLVYEFCAPFSAGGQDGVNGGNARSCTGVRPDPSNCRPPFQEVSYRLPTYSAINPLGGDPRVTIDPNTGFITGIPTIQGQFVVGVCVKEFRDGELIGTLKRDFQFNVAQCEPIVVAELVSEAVVNGKEFLINSCGENTINFENESYNINNIKSYDWTFVSGNTTLSSTERNASITFPGVGQYDGTMIINKGTECSDTANISVNIYPSITADFIYSYDTCIAGPVRYEDMSSSEAGPIIDWKWKFGDGALARTENPHYQYQNPGEFMPELVVTDENFCMDSLQKAIDWSPAPSLIVIEPSTFIGCKPAVINFNNLSSPIDSNYLIEWDFGDGQKGDALSPTHIYEETGVYDVNVHITSPLGCEVSKKYPSWIQVLESPVADFKYSPEEPSVIKKSVSFRDESEQAIGWLWRFGEIGSSVDRNPVFTFPDTGRYEVQLVVVNEVSCPDTLIQIVDVKPLSSYFLPNAFTPNNDAKNDEFIGIGLSRGIKDFQLSIFNRWGEKVFQSNDPDKGWNGRKHNNGEDAPTGVYVYMLEYRTPRGQKKIEKGHLTLLR